MEDELVFEVRLRPAEPFEGVVAAPEVEDEPAPPRRRDLMADQRSEEFVPLWSGRVDAEDEAFDAVTVVEQAIEGFDPSLSLPGDDVADPALQK